LPVGYDGCDDATVLVHVAGLGVEVWPVRIDLGDIEEEGGRHPPTLYHFTHRQSFQHFVGLFSGRQDDDEPMQTMEVFRSVWEAFHADFRERSAKATEQNPHNDPELFIVEPARFRSKEEILHSMFGGHYNPNGFSSGGTPCNNFADCCVAVRVSSSVCFPTESLGNHSLMRLDRHAVEALHLRAEQRAEMARLKEEEDEDKQEERGGTAGCLSALCGSGKKEQSWKDMQRARAKDDRKKAKGEDRVCRDKKIMDVRVVQLTNKWAKEHYAGAKKLKDETALVRKKQEEEEASRLARLEARKAAQKQAAGGKTATATNRKAGPKFRASDQASDTKEEEVARDNVSITQMLIAKIKVAIYGDPMDKEALSLYKAFQARELGEKEFGPQPMMRMKLGRHAAQARAKALAEQHGASHSRHGTGHTGETKGSKATSATTATGSKTTSKTSASKESSASDAKAGSKDRRNISKGSESEKST